MPFRLILFCFLIFYSFNSLANVDSIGVEDNKGKMLIIHKIEPKETYYSLGRKYNVSPSAIIEFNQNIALQPGMLVKVPTERPFLETGMAQRDGLPEESTSIIEYKVAPKETLYLIANRFNTTVEEIKQLNNLKSTNLSIGQILKVRQGNTAASSNQTLAIIKPEVNIAPRSEEPEAIKTESKVPSNRYGLRAVVERGLAIWMEDDDIDASKLLALHRTAPIGTVIKITNPSSQKSTFAKVVGSFGENESTKNVIIVVSKATADLLGAIDKRFQVTIDYGLAD